ncbi:hypothetical protein [Paraburkholderia sp. SIMBA_054]|uniref:hypothetical protein n=1 Tax=Paraburkholderia sp. SIMBA_054 TaxID=3085795 RepID=UPI0039799F74
MVSRFKFTISTVHGSMEGEEVANSEQQLRACMPAEVTALSIDAVTDRPGVPDVMDEELWLHLCSAVDNLEYASTLTPEIVAQHHADQVRALNGLQVEIALPSNNAVLAARLTDLAASLRDEPV